jgi:DHA1 family multidrug resistance protein-like MFS transporter
VFLAFSAAFPFMSLYVQQMGIVDRQVSAGWAGLINGASTALVAVMNAIWGSAADRWGAKLGLVRSLVLCVVGLVVCGLATTPEYLLVGRLIQAAGGGANAAAIIVVSSLVPTTALGTSMGLMQTAQALAGTIGPAIGGLVGDVFGFRYAFMGSAALLAIVTAAVVLFVGEPKRELRPAAHKEHFFAGLGYVFRAPTVRKLLVIYFGFQVAYQSVWTFLPLRVQDMVSESLVGRWSGAAILGDALGMAVGALLVSWLSRRFSIAPRTLVVLVGVVAGLSTVVQILVGFPEALIGLRVIVGLCYGAAIVLLRTALGEAADPSRRGVTFGVAHSAFAAGFSFGALVASAIIGIFGLVAAFVLSALAFGLVAAWSSVALVAPERA